MTKDEQDLAFAKEVIETLEMMKLISQATVSSMQLYKSNKEAASALLHGTLPVQRGLEKSIARLIEMTRT